MNVWVGAFNDTLRADGDILHVFAKPDNPAWITQAIDAAHLKKQVPMITIEPWDDTGKWTYPTDKQIDAIATAVHSNTPVLLRYMHEMNGDWYPWAGDPLRFKAEWNRFFLRMPANVRSIWCPNVYPNPATAYWPTVLPSRVGVDGYTNDGGVSFGEAFGPTLADLRRISPNAPLMVCETACPRGEKQARWVRGMWDWLAANHPDVDAVLWFDKDKEQKWALSPKARAALLARGGQG